MIINKKGKWIVILGFWVLIFLTFALAGHVEANDSNGEVSPERAGVNMDSSIILPDLFKGQMSYSIPIDVIAGRKGVQPSLALTYRSNKGNGWVGVGWEMEIGAIERSTVKGLTYDDNIDTFILRMGGAAIDLIYDGSPGFGFYRAKIENDFYKIQKISSGQVFYWQLTDKSGRKQLFGRTDASRQYDPANPNKVFKWCLDRVEDTNGNYMDITYDQHPPNGTGPYEGQIYLKQIAYTGNTGAPTTNSVNFYYELRTDAPAMYTTHFLVKTSYRLKTIDIIANSNRVRTYSLAYDYSPMTGRSLLTSVQQFDKNVAVDSNGTVTGGSSDSLPPIILGYQFDTPNFTDDGIWYDNWCGGQQMYMATLDFNGDGITDVACHDWTTGATGVSLSNGVKPFPNVSNITTNMCVNTVARQIGTGYFNDDGKEDLYCFTPSTGTADVTLSSGDSFGADKQWLPGWVTNYWAEIGDFDGDGHSDLVQIQWDPVYGGNAYVALSNGIDGFTVGANRGLWLPNWCPQAYGWLSGDFNGDGKTDVYCHTSNGNNNYVALSNGAGFTLGANGGLWLNNWCNVNYPDYATLSVGDVNGDGLKDLICWQPLTGNVYVAISNGVDGFTVGANGGLWRQNWCVNGWNYLKGGLGDFNDDGMMDLFCNVDNVEVALSNGKDAFINGPNGSSWLGVWGPLPNHETFPGDFNGDGKTDLLSVMPGYPLYVALSGTLHVRNDLLTSISNGIGGTTSIRYKPSTQYVNTQLPFAVQTASEITTDDGHGAVAKTTYTYSGGFYHIGERDFRGFNYVKVTGPTGPNNEQRITETWFHQGNDTAVDVNDPRAHDGYMEGKPYRTRISDGTGNKYSEVTTIYSPDVSLPYFNPPLQVDSYICDGGPCGIHTKTTYNYDSHGNVSMEKYYDNAADLTPYRSVSRNFSSNVPDWIVGLPLSETVYQGDLTGTPVSMTTYYYDGIGANDCDSASTNQNPSQGNITRIVRWFKEKQSNEYDPEVHMAYDKYGNLSCTRDAKGNISTLTYDSSTSTYPSVATNALGHQTKYRYYGIDVPADKGLYGQVQSVTDPNDTNNVKVEAVTEYDTFGRKTKNTMPDGTWQRWDYSPLGTVGSQYVRLSDINGLSSTTYFDGLGRTYLEQKTGPGGKTIYTETEYNKTGTVKRTSSPNFSAAPGDQLWTTYFYDPIGRITQVKNPESKSVFACYSPGITVGIDVDKHRKRETRDSLGRLVKVEEFTDTYDSCLVTGGTLYATTRYDYDVLGNLIRVTDSSDIPNITEIHYDSLGRKTDMTDPDMGKWTYQYDANSNLYKQTDAKNHTITFNYDELNRLKLKSYPTGTNVSYTYDVSPDTAIPTFPIGRLSTMTDASGTTKYFYDNIGRSTATRKTVDGKDYTVKVGYDNGRMAGITYPDNETIRYSYGTGNELNTVRNLSDYIYAYYPAADYTALGQPRTLINGNGVTTAYQYDPVNSRLKNITTSYFDKQLLNLTYDYTDGGNIKSITDPDQPAITSPSESVTYTYGGTKPHFVTSTTDGRTYTPDPNGNMLSDGMRTIIYDYDNMPTSVTTNGITTSFVYDGAGARVMKMNSYGPTIYIGKLYECREDICTKYIFANGKRIASKISGDILYYHQDHLGSTRVVTNDTGVNQESSYYYPFGETQADTGMSVSHKYTSQEFDDETGLYYYNARYYDPVLGRFISADSNVPHSFNPQSLNRYSYVMNRPLNYIDPVGLEDESGSDLGDLGLDFGDLGPDLGGVTLAANTFTFYDAHIEFRTPDTSPTSDQKPSSGSIPTTVGISISTPGTVDQNVTNYDADIDVPSAQPVTKSSNMDNGNRPFGDYSVVYGNSFVNGGLFSNFKTNLEGRAVQNAAAGNYLGWFVDWAGMNFLPDSYTGTALMFMPVGRVGIEAHHLFPRAFRSYFGRAGINIEAFTVNMATDAHRLLPSGVHTGPSNWNAVWKEFIEKNPNATEDQIWQQLERMLR